MKNEYVPLTIEVMKSKENWMRTYK